MESLKLGVAFLFFLSSVHAGQEVGNGIDSLSPEHGAAWFVGNKRKVRFCVEYSQDFGRARDSLTSLVQSAYEKWDKYLRDRFPDKASVAHLIPTTQVLPLELCDGTEDLKFYFGVLNSKVKKIRDTKYSNPVAFAHRLSYEIKEGWGKGFIWVASHASIDPAMPYPNWQDSPSLFGVILHEIGHVLGTGHVRGTIMTDQLAHWLRNPDLVLRKEKLSKIDWTSYLVPPFQTTKPITLKGNFGMFVGMGQKINEQAATFQLLTCRAPVGKVSAKFVFEIRSFFHINKAKIEFSDKLGKFERLIDLPKIDVLTELPRISIDFRSQMAFKAVVGSKNGFSVMGVQSHGFVQYGALKGCKGRTLPVMFDTNMRSFTNRGPIVLRYFHKGKTRILFQSGMH